MAELDSYRQKRDFTLTREPEGAQARTAGGPLRFVVQKHAARRLHYDVRLELDGVLKSWAVPRGPSLDPQEKRMARMTEDHPLDYRTFEGEIPKGAYGAGQMIVWDAGVYTPDEGGKLSFEDRDEAEQRMRAGVLDGKLSFTLRGHKLQGSWTLVRTRQGPADWLVIKHRDATADAERDVLADDRSVISGLTVENIKAGRIPEPSAVLVPRGKPGPFPSDVKVMSASIVDTPFSDAGWVFEPKLDGFRVIALVRSGKVTLRSRNGTDLTEKFPRVAEELAVQPEEQLVLDGELVAINEQGLPDFGLLQRSLELPKSARISSKGEAQAIKYYPFDILYVDGMDLKGLPLHERASLLRRVLLPAETVEPVEYIEEEGEAFYRAAVEMGLEGVVAKRKNSHYEAGKRSTSWLKIKAIKAQDFVVGGYTLGEGARSDTFGSLILGYNENGGLRYAGRAGSGFDQRTLEHVARRMADLAADEPPFMEQPELDGFEPRWIRPELVAEVKFSQWTHEDKLRAPVFLRLRDDVDPRSVVRVAETTGAELGVGRSDAPAAADTGVEEVLGQIAAAKKKLLLEVAGHKIGLTNLDKVLWPASDGQREITKGEMIAYYARISPLLIPHLRDRPLTLTRYPNGIHGKSFYQKNMEHEIPEFVETVRLFSSHNEGDVEYVMVNNLPTLIWLAQLADIEMHPWLSRTAQEPDGGHLSTQFTGSEEAIRESALNYPDFIVFDFDPYIYSGKEKSGDEPELNRRAFSKTVEMAWQLKGLLDELSLSAFLKTSGKTGLHVYVPVQRQYDFRLTRKTCETVGHHLLRGHPRDLTMEWTIEKRTGKIFFDHNQNVRGKNMASIYSLRPAPGAPVSTPVSWDELDDVYPTDFTIDTVPERVDALGDLWAGVMDAKHDLSRLLEAAE